jgi:hypothetical protein
MDCHSIVKNTDNDTGRRISSASGLGNILKEKGLGGCEKIDLEQNLPKR